MLVLRVEVHEQAAERVRVAELVARGEHVAEDRAVAVVHVIQAARVEIQVAVGKAGVEPVHGLHRDAELAGRTGFGYGVVVAAVAARGELHLRVPAERRLQRAEVHRAAEAAERRALVDRRALEQVGGEAAQIPGRAGRVERNAVERELRLRRVVALQRDRLRRVAIVARRGDRDARELVQRVGEIGGEPALRRVLVNAGARDRRRRLGRDLPDHFQAARVHREGEVDGHHAAVEHFERGRGQGGVAAAHDARAIDPVGHVGERDLAVLAGDLRGDDRAFEQHAGEFERLLGRGVNDDDVNLAAVGLGDGTRR